LKIFAGKPEDAFGVLVSARGMEPRAPTPRSAILVAGRATSPHAPRKAGPRLVRCASSRRSPVAFEAGLLRDRALGIEWIFVSSRLPMPAFHWIVITYVVFVLFGFYLLYMYEPITTHYLFSRIFTPLI
jgi:hypothetical protein